MTLCWCLFIVVRKLVKSHRIRVYPSRQEKSVTYVLTESVLSVPVTSNSQLVTRYFWLPPTSPNTSACLHLNDKHPFDGPHILLQSPIRYLEPHRSHDIFPHGFDEHPQSQSTSWNRSEKDSLPGLQRLAESQAHPLPESCVNPSWSIYAK